MLLGICPLFGQESFMVKYIFKRILYMALTFRKYPATKVITINAI